MPQTFYVTQDEEILSLVGRLRSSALLENVFVVPKRALILQSVVNLRILAREAEKIGKSVVIITQDNDGRLLAEKAGIATRAYSEEALVADRPTPAAPQEKEPVAVQKTTDHQPQSTSIGSDDFFGSGRKDPSQIVPPPVSAPPDEGIVHEQAMETKLRIRNAGPKYQTALNSSLLEQEPDRSSESPDALLRRQALEHPQPVSTGQASVRENGRLAHVFRNRENDSDDRIRRPEPAAKKPSHHEGDGSISTKGRFWFFLFIAVSVLSLIGTGAFFFLPKAEVVIVPKSAAQDIEMEFEGKQGDAIGDLDIPIRVIEKEMEITVSMETSGDSSGTGERAKGKITIFNAFSEEPQPLVATTRFESPEGKVFRLTRGVTVPGMSEVNGKKEPGAIEAEVSADAPGESYNIGPSTFIIPGFKGSSKYEKFSAESKGKMLGGTSGEGDSSARALSADDISRAKELAEQRFKEAFGAAVQSELSEEDRFILSSAEFLPVGTPSHPQVGVAASSFEYVSKWSGKVFVFSEADLRKKAGEFFMARAGRASEVRDVSFTYGETSADFEKGTIFIRSHVNALLVENVDADSLKNELLGKNTEGIKAVLERHSEVKKMDIDLKPKFVIFSVPENPDRVTVRVEMP